MKKSLTSFVRFLPSMAEKSQEEEEIDEELKFDSSNFNALKVLTLGNVPVPFPNVKPLNNLAQYQSLVTGKKKKEAKTKSDVETTPKTRGPVPAPRPKNAPLPPTTTTEEKEHKGTTRHKRNVLTRMEENHQKGPMSLLRRSVYEQLRVKVCIRSAAYVRGFCQGFIVAYDRHFNMAMIDVDETYRKPIFPKRRKNKIVITTIVPSVSPPNSDWECSETDSEEEENPKSKLEIKDKPFLEEKVIIGNEDKEEEEEEPKYFSKHCLSSVIEPCLVYNRLKTKVCYRHVNQLFIRGDSVVSVAIVE